MIGRSRDRLCTRAREPAVVGSERRRAGEQESRRAGEQESRRAGEQEETMRVRIIYGKLRPGTWDAYEAAYKEIMERAGQVAGLRARWLTRDVDNPDAGYSI